MHLVNLLLGYSLIIQCGAILCEFAHLCMYALNGHGLRFRYSWLPLDFMSEVLRGVSEILTSFTLICLASGWTLGVEESKGKDPLSTLLVGFRKPATLLTKVSPSTMFAAFFIGAQVLLEMAGRNYSEDFASFHDHEHVPGYLLIALRLLLCVVFFLGCSASMSSCLASGSVEMAGFYSGLRLVGTVWFLTFPATVVIASLLSPYHRNPFVEGSNIILHLSTMTIMLYQTMFGGKYESVSSIKMMGNMFGGGKKIAVD
jgi:hypothetical protein